MRGGLKELPGLLTAQKFLVESYKVTELNDDPVPPERFALRYDEPGTFIADGTLPGAENQPNGRVSYRQPAAAEDLDEVIRAATESGYRPRSRAAWVSTLLGLNVAAVAAGVVYWVWRRRSARKAS